MTSQDLLGHITRQVALCRQDDCDQMRLRLVGLLNIIKNNQRADLTQEDLPLIEACRQEVNGLIEGLNG